MYIPDRRGGIGPAAPVPRADSLGPGLVLAAVALVVAVATVATLAFLGQRYNASGPGGVASAPVDLDGALAQQTSNGLTLRITSMEADSTRTTLHLEVRGREADGEWAMLFGRALLYDATGKDHFIRSGGAPDPSDRRA